MKKVGIIGGGQLGKMMILDGRRLDTKFFILDPTFSCPAHAISDLHIVADFDDIEAIRRLAACSDVVTYEFEHISVEALKAVEADGIPVYPSSRTLELIQDKYVQKDWMRRNGIPVPEFLPVETKEDIFAAVDANTVLVSIMLVNNETGAVFDVKKASDIIKSADEKILFH